MQAYLPIVVMFAISLVFCTVFLTLSKIAGPKRGGKSKESVYECGAPSVGSTRERFSVKFFLVAMLFILFDIEIVFMYPWAVVYKKSLDESGLTFANIMLFAEMVIFFVLLNLGLFFAWRKKALEWSRS